MTARVPGTDVAVVVPTVGRTSLTAVIEGLVPARSAPAVLPRTVVLVDDRRSAGRPLLEGRLPPVLADRLRVVRGRAAGPAAAREIGWRSTSTPWVSFLDDDVVPPAGWFDALLDDLSTAGPDVAAVQGRIRVPLAPGRRPTDWERNVAGLESARWATADMAYRRAALVAVGGFDERFPRAYREDADLALRVERAGWRLEVGRRQIDHPVRPAPATVSLELQRGNADDPFMAARHGRWWRVAADVPAGRRSRHLAVTAAGVAGLAALLAGRRTVAGVALAGWVTGTADFAAARLRPGPRDVREVAVMLATSAAIPPAATWWWLRGWAATPARLRRAGPDERRPVPAGSPLAGPSLPAPGRRPAEPLGGERPGPDAVLFDRDGTLVEDVPYNGDPAEVRLRCGAVAAVARLRAAGVAVGMVTNQSGIGRGLITEAQARAVNDRVAELVGGLDHVELCPHAPDAGCSCRKPAPGLVLAAAAALGAEPTRCVVIGDIGADVGAAVAAGARGILVPTPVTLAGEVASAAEVADSLLEAVELALGEAELPTPAPATEDDGAEPADGEAFDPGGAGRPTASPHPAATTGPTSDPGRRSRSAQGTRRREVAV